MNDYQVWDDIDIICDLLNIAAADFARQISVTPDSVSRWKNNKTDILRENLNTIYDFAFVKKIRLNKIKEQFIPRRMYGKESCNPFSRCKNLY